MTTQLILLTVLLCFIATVVALQGLRPVAYAIDLLDKPVGGRKRHVGAVPLIGGIAIYISVCILSLFFLQEEFIISLLACSGCIVIMGVLDDQYDISASIRLGLQAIICSVVVLVLDVRIESLGDLVSLGDVQLGFFSAPISILALIAAMNALNFMDGIDGLVGSIAFVSFASLAYLFFRNEQTTEATFCLLLCAGLAPFLMFNIWGKHNKPYFHKVFMGDAGSMFLGLVLGALIIKGSQGEQASFTPISGLWLIVLPLTDMVTLMYRRVRRGQSPMAADRTHLHHIFMRAGLSSKKTLLLLIFAQMFLAFVSYSHVPLSWLIHLSLFAIWLVGYQYMMFRAWKIVRFLRRRYSVNTATL